MRGIERVQDVPVGDVIVGHRQVLALVQTALVLERDVRHRRPGQEGGGVGGDDLVDWVALRP